MTHEELVPNVVDYGETGDDFVCGICSVTRLSAGTVRVQWYSEKISDGRVERRIIRSLVCPIEVLKASILAVSHLLDRIEKAEPLWRLRATDDGVTAH